MPRKQPRIVEEQAPGRGVGGGPKTPAGKAKASRNALRHGGRARATLLVGDETQAEYDGLAEMWRERFEPDTALSRYMVEKLVRNEWLLLRAERNLLKAEAAVAELGDDPLEWPEAAVQRLQLMQRYKLGAERAAARAYQTIRQFETDNMEACLAERKFVKEQAREQMERAEWKRRREAEEREFSEERGPAEPETEQAVAPPAEQPAARPIRWPEPVPKTPEVPHLQQTIAVHIEAGRAVTASVQPANEELIAQAKNLMAADAELEKVLEIWRRFEFRDGIPAEYGWTTKDRREAYGRGASITIAMSYAELLACDERERERGDGHLWGELE